MLEPELQPLGNSQLIRSFTAHNLRNQNALSQQTTLSIKQRYLYMEYWYGKNGSTVTAILSGTAKIAVKK